MSTSKPDLAKELQIDVNQLYREEVFTDLAVASFRRMTPVKPDGTTDPSRPVFFVASTQIMSQAGPLPVSAEIEVATLPEAVAKFPEAIQASLERMVEEAREFQRREASRLVVPGPGAIPPAGKGPISLR